MDRNVDLAVIGAGPAGLEAAIAASRSGLSTVLIDSQSEIGGQYLKPDLLGAVKGNKTRVQEQRQKLLDQTASLPVDVHINTLVWGIYPEDSDWLLALHGSPAPATLRAHTIIIATGAADLPIPFPGWTLPGVMTAGAALTLLKQGALPGKRILLSGTGPLQIALASNLVQAGVKPVSVLESAHISLRWLKRAPAAWGQWSRIGEGFEYLSTLALAGVPFRRGWVVTAAFGQEELEAVEVSRIDPRGNLLPGSQQMLPVDTLVTGYGLIPNNGLARLPECQGSFISHYSGFIPQRDETLQSSQAGIFIAGDAAGVKGAPYARLEGRLAGFAAARYTKHISHEQFQREHLLIRNQLANEHRFAGMLSDLFHPAPGLFSMAKDDTIVCRCEEVTLGEIRQAIARGARSPNEIKLWTRAGMGNCQGRICENYLVHVLHSGISPELSRGFTVRPPLHPLPVGLIAGYLEHT
jgi:D-hydroxyproline dehydrogenase subunit alpha